MPPSKGTRTQFTTDEDTYLMKYIATYNPSKAGRSGNEVYRRLVDNVDRKWAWSSRHSWQSWRNRYVKYEAQFDYRIERYQKRKGITTENGGKIADGTSKVKRKAAIDNEKEKERNGKRRRYTAEDGGNRKKAKVNSKEVKANEGGRTAVDLVNGEEHNSGEGGNPVVKIEKGVTGQIPVESKVQSNRDKATEDDVGEEEEEQLAVAVHEEEEEDADEEELHKLVETLNDDQTHGVEIQSADRHEKEIPGTPLRSPQPDDANRLYPSIDNLPSPNLPQPAEDQPIPGTLGSSAVTTSQVSKPPSPKPAQEPTPPTSSVDPRSPAITTGDRQSHIPSSVRAPIRYGAPSPMPPPAQPSRQYLKRKQKQKEDADENFFADVDMTPSRQSGPAPQLSPQRQPSVSFEPSKASRAREPPRIVHGPFSSTMTDRRGRTRKRRIGNVTGTDEDEQGDVWPPKRRGGKGKSAERVIDVDSPVNQPRKHARQPEHAPLKAEGVSRRVTVTSVHHPFSQPTQHPDAQELLAQYSDRYTNSASSREAEIETVGAGDRQEVHPFDVDAEGEHHPFSQPSQSPAGVSNLGLGSPFKTPADIYGLGGVDAGAAFASPWERMEAFPLPARFASRGVTGLLNVGGGSRRSMSAVDQRRPSGERAVSRVSSRMPSRIPDHLPRAPSVVSSSDPFIVPLVQGRDKGKAPAFGNRRQTFGGYDTRRDKVPKIDLAAQSRKKRRRHRQSFPGDPRRRLSHLANSETSSLTSSPLTPLSTADQSIITRMGIDAIIKKLSENYQFREDYIRDLWHKIGDLEKTDMVLAAMKQGAEERGLKVMERMEGTDDEQEQLEFFRSSSRRKSAIPEPPLFQISTAPLDDHESEYDPPETSRAGQYSRLVKEGRKAEAMRRELKRASQGGVSPQKIRVVNLLHQEIVSRRSSTVTENMDSQEDASPHDEYDSAEEDQEDDEQMVSQGPIWGEEEDALLRSGDVEVLKELEEKMGRAAVRQRTAELLGVL